MGSCLAYGQFIWPRAEHDFPILSTIGPMMADGGRQASSILSNRDPSKTPT